MTDTNTWTLEPESEWEPLKNLVSEAIRGTAGTRVRERYPVTAAVMSKLNGLSWIASAVGWGLLFAGLIKFGLVMSPLVVAGLWTIGSSWVIKFVITVLRQQLAK